MQRLTLPGTDMTTSQLCLGTNQFGTVLDDERVADILAAYTALGGNFLDTAAAYGDWMSTAPRGASELALGRWLARQRREDWIIALSLIHISEPTRPY